MPLTAEPVLIVDSAEYRRDLATISDIRAGIKVPALVAEVLRELGLASASLGLIARESLLLSSYRLLCDELSAPPKLVPSDDILEALRMVKSPGELALMRRAADIGAECMAAMTAAAQPGNTEGDVAGAGWNIASKRGAYPYDIAITSGPHSHQFQWARLPSWDAERRLEDGDLMHIDLYGPAAEGYWTDFVRSTVIGGKPTAGQEALLEATIEHVHTIVDAVKPGVTFGELWSVGDRWRHANGFGGDAAPGSALPGLEAMFPAFGHCIGLGGGEPPYLTEASDAVVQENMVIAVETLLVDPEVGGAGFEEDIVVGPSRCAILTEPSPARPW